MNTLDRISELPDPILHHMLSFLPMQQVVETIVLSKRWKQSWNTFPSFEFVGNCNSFDTIKVKLRNLEQALLKRCTDRISVNKFKLDLQIPVDQDILTSVSHCLGYAIESNVKVLNLSIEKKGLYSASLYNLPPIVLSSKSIEVLKLSGCNLVIPKSNVMLSSLRSLCLWHIAADDNIIENVVGGSPLIEQLEIIYCRGLTSLVLAGLNRLKKFRLHDIDALKRLKINVHNVCEVDVIAPSLSEISLGGCENLKSLSLHELPITDDWLYNEIPKCPLLESLCINMSNQLERIKVSSHCLKTLCIFDCSKLFEVNIETPNLSMLKYEGDLISFSSNGLVLPEADLYFDSMNMDAQWFVRYIELLAKFHKFFTALTLSTSTRGENVIVPKELRKILHPPLFGVSQLTLILLFDVEGSISEILDGLLWISPHVETIFLKEEYEDGHRDKATIQFLYKKELICEEDSKTPHCCQSLPVSCWQHCMKEVNIEFYRMSGKIFKKRFSIQDEQFLEKIDGLFPDLDSSEDEINVPDDHAGKAYYSN